MNSRKQIAQLNKCQRDRIFYISLFVVSLLIFLFVGSREPVLYDDSGSYVSMKRWEGVMPLYPLFLFLNQIVFGMDSYLKIVIIEQAAVAAVCTLLIVREIKERFVLQYREGYFIFFLALLPYTTELPAAMITQTILTEALAYALFYLLLILYLRAVWRNSFSYLAGSFAMVFLLSMLRSQLQILYIVCGVLFLYLLWKRYDKKLGKPGCAVLGLIGCAAVSVAGVWLTAALLHQYNILINENMTLSVFIMKIQEPDYYQEFLISETGENRKQEEIEEAVRDVRSEMESMGGDLTLSQYTSLIMSRGMYEADEGDAQLYQDEMIRGLFQTIYQAADGKGQRYAYEERGLWMWKDIVGGIGSVGWTCVTAGNDYFREKYPELYMADYFNEIWNQSLQIIGFGLIRKHFGRFLYHMLMLLPQAFICTVFFQIKPIYLLCHLVTLFLYLSALALMIWGYADRKASNQCAEFMALILGSNVVMIVIISLVFFGQQRYLVYNFGAFYMAYYVLLRELWNCRLRDFLMERRFRKEGRTGSPAV